MIKKLTSCRKETRSAMRGGKGDVKFEHIWKPGDELKGHFRLFSRIILEPGCSIGYHVHENEEEIFVIEKGKAEADDNGTKVILNAGDSIVTRGGEGHAIRALGEETVELLAVIGTY